MKMLLINDKAGSVRTAAAEAQRFTQQGYAARPLPEWREFVEGRVDGSRKLRRQSRRKQRAA
jgi:hypothetical protein